MNWAVTVERDGEKIVTIEPSLLSGREIDALDEEAIRAAAHSLMAFIGDEYPRAKDEGCPICNGDCAGANPPMAYCPVRDGDRG